jgi:hypothetical protein
VTSSLDRRLRQLRSRVLVRAWDYRQRRHARGVWYRLRRLLADAREVYAITREDAELLAAEGLGIEQVGRELQPPKLIVFAPAERVARMPSARPLPVRLSADVVLAECLALVPF